MKSCIAIFLLSFLLQVGFGNALNCFLCAYVSNVTTDACSEDITSNISTCEDSTACIKFSKTQACYHGIVEVMFVVDGSGSVGSDNFAKVKDWLISITKSLIEKFGDTVRYQVLQYSNKDRRKDRIPIEDSKKFEIPYTLNERLSIEEMGQRIQDMPYLDSLTYTYFALLRAMTVEFPKSNCFEMSKKIVVVLTDGNADDGASLSRWYSDYNNTVTTIAIGVGSRISLSELRTIANGDSSNERVWPLEDFDQLQGSRENIPNEVAKYVKSTNASFIFGCGEMECNETNSDGIERVEYNLNYTLRKTCCTSDYCNCNSTECVDAAKVHLAALRSETTTYPFQEATGHITAMTETGPTTTENTGQTIIDGTTNMVGTTDMLGTTDIVETIYMKQTPVQATDMIATTGKEKTTVTDGTKGMEKTTDMDPTATAIRILSKLNSSPGNTTESQNTTSIATEQRSSILFQMLIAILLGYNFFCL